MKNTKKKIAILVAAASVIVISFGATLAFLTSETNKKENVFTPAPGINVDIEEPNWETDKDGDGHIGKEDAENYLPNQLIEKDPFLTNTSTSNKNNDEYVSLELEYIIYDKNGLAQQVNYDEFSKIAEVYTGTPDEASVKGFNSAWKALEVDECQYGKYDRFLYYGSKQELEILAKGQSTESLFDYVKINPELRLQNSDGSENILSLTNVKGEVFQAAGMPRFDITVKGFAIQSDNISTDDAKAELIKLMEQN